MAFSFVENSVNPLTADQTQSVLIYELGALEDSLFSREKQPDYQTYGKTELSDCICMCRMLCEQESWSYNEINFYYPEPYIDFFNLYHQIRSSSCKLVQQRHYHRVFGDYSRGTPFDSMTILLHWLYTLCEKMGWNYWEIQDMGEKRYKQRMKDIIEHGVKSKLKSEVINPKTLTEKEKVAEILGCSVEDIHVLDIRGDQLVEIEDDVFNDAKKPKL